MLHAAAYLYGEHTVCTCVLDSLTLSYHTSSPMICPQPLCIAQQYETLPQSMASSNKQHMPFSLSPCTAA